MSNEFIYLASPYSHDDPVIRDQRYQLACRACADLMHEGKHVFSPIVHWHDCARLYSLPTDAKWWKEYNLKIFTFCSAVYVLPIGGWEQSKGVKMELKWAQEQRKRVTWLYELI